MLNKIVIALTLVISFAIAEETGKVPTASKDSISVKSMKTIGDLEKYLVSSFENYGLNKKGPISYCSDTKALYSIARDVINKSPDSPEAKGAFQLCSLSTESSVEKFRNSAKMMKIIATQDKVIKTLRETIATMSAISETEKSKTSKLMADLAEERAKAKKLRDEADKKFSELQSSLIQVSNDARGTIISMSDILFAVGKADLTADLKTSLAKISGILMVFKTSKVLIEGHTDNSGSEDFNMTLSEHRASNVMSFMIEQGVAADRLMSKGFGFTKPIADNSTSEGRSKNRRVDLVIQDKK